MPPQTLPLRHFLLALSIVAVWGTNFVVIQVALAKLPPLLFAALRFALVFFPCCLFMRRPAVPWRDLAAYGLLIGVGQFGLLFLAMNGHITPGLASLVIQTQVFFTIFLSMRITAERVRPMQWVALGVAVTGIGVIVAHTDGSTTPAGLGMILLAAASWAGGNMVARASSRAANVNAVAYVVWSGIFAAVPLLALSMVFEGLQAIATGLQSANVGTWAAVAWQSVGNSLFGYAMWAWLLARYPAATVSPMALLVPVFGMAASSLLLAEPMPLWKLIAMVLVMVGLGLNMLKSNAVK
jgi:O-acetylserine/cysteine efflux transporter